MQSEKVFGLSVSRRALLRGGALGAAGLATAALIGCGDDEEDEESVATAPSGGDSSQGDDSSTGDDTVATGPGVLIQNPDLPYPYNIPEPAKTPKAGGTLRVAASWDVSVFDPTKSAAGGTITVPNTVYNRLLGFAGGLHADPLGRLELEPELATSWERSPDGLTYTFSLTPGVKWQNIPPLNGRDFVAADAKFAYERYQAGGVHKSIWSSAESIDAVDDRTLKITLNKPLADFIWPLGGRYQTIFPHELVDDGSIDTTVIGTGPMIMTEAVQSDHVSFEKNPDYWQRDVLLDGMEFRIMPDHSSRLAAFRAGQIEYAYALLGKRSDVDDVQKTNPDVQVLMYGGTAGGYGLGLNLQHPKFQDERVRQAISLAMDHETTIAIIYEGLGFSLPNTPWAYLYDSPPTLNELGPWVTPQGNPEEARKLLEAAGVEDLDITAIYYAYGSYDTQRSELLPAQMEAAGIKFRSQLVDYTQFNSQWVPGKLEEATTTGWAAVGFDSDNYFYNQVHSTSPGNRWHISDPQIDGWAEQQQVELDSEARKAIQQKIWDRDLQMMYRFPQAGGYTYDIQQPWLRALRWGGALGSQSYYYDWGDQVASVWLDK